MAEIATGPREKETVRRKSRRKEAMSQSESLLAADEHENEYTVNEVQRTNPWANRYVALLLTLGVALIFAMAALAVQKKPHEVQLSPPLHLTAGQCTTNDCVTTAKELMAAVDESVDPCEDFYGFACGKWTRDNPIPDEESSWSTFNVLRKIVKERLRKLFDSDDIANGSQGSVGVMSNLKAYYTSCLDTDAIESNGIGPVMEVLDDVDNWVKGNLSLGGLLANLHTIHVSAIFDMQVWVDDGDNTRNILLLSQGGLGLPSKDYYGKADVVEKYISMLAKLLQLAKVSSTDEAARGDAEIVFAIEKKIAEISLAPDELRDPEKNYNLHTIAKLQELTQDWDQFDWQEYLKGVGALPLPKEVNVITPSFIKDIPNAIGSNNNQLALYFKARVLSSLAKHMSKAFVEQADIFNLALSGAQPKERWDICVDETHVWFMFAAGRLYAAEHFPPATRAVALAMVEDVTLAMKDTLDKIDWMADSTKKKAYEKLKRIENKIGYPDEIFEDTWLAKEYEQNTASAGTYLANVLQAKRATTLRDIAKLNVPADHSRWFTDPAVVNAFYEPTSNDITFPAGILLPPFFSAAYPTSLNYGGIGMIIGHEITHGFDDQGRKYDMNGQLNDWWTAKDGQEFDHLAQCFVDQYDKYTVEVTNGTMNVNGKLTLGENIGDNGGLEQAWKAYQSWVAKNGEEPALPGVTLTHDQLLYVNFARGFCGAYRPAQMEQQIRTNVHAPGRERVLGSVSNSNGFAKAFHCTKGARLNPSKKCAIW